MAVKVAGWLSRSAPPLTPPPHTTTIPQRLDRDRGLADPVGSTKVRRSALELRCPG